MTVIESFQEEIEKLVDKECWGIVDAPGTGSVINLSIGDKYPKKIPSKNINISELERKYESENSFMISCP